VSDLEALVEELARRVVRQELARHVPTWNWLSPESAAELLGCAPKTIYSKLDRGILTRHKLDGRVYVSRRELDQLIREARG
jgi:excisionase family DNA binding protein